MCWACLQANHLDLPSDPQHAVRRVTDARALLATVDNDNLSWSSPLPGNKGPVIVTYNFTESWALPTRDYWGYPYSVDKFFSYNATQRANFRQALEEYSRVSGVIFVETKGKAMLNAYGAEGSDYGGWAEYSESNDYFTRSGGLVIDSDDNFQKGSYGYLTALHEIGHAMGLKHPFEGSIRLTEAADSTRNTVMSYTQVDTPQNLQTLDIKALRMLYGGPVNDSGWKLAVKNGDLVARGSGRADPITGVGLIDNHLSGLGGKDTLIGREKNDTLMGGDGNDLLLGMYGKDRLSGGEGNDTIKAGDGRGQATFGNGGNDVLIAIGYAERLSGGSGNDSLRAIGYGARLDGGAGRDTLVATDGQATLLGGDGNDHMTATDGASVQYGGSGQDTIYGRDDTYDYGDEQLHGGAGYDLIFGRAGDDRLYAEADGGELYGALGEDTLVGGNSGASRLFGGGGVDDLFAGDGLATLEGGTGDDNLYGGSRATVMRGDDGADLFRGGTGAATIYGGNGNDQILAETGTALIHGDAGNDHVSSGNGNATIFGDAGNDRLSGETESGGRYAGTVRLDGGTGADSLTAGGDGDTLTGGADTDRFYFKAWIAGRFTVTDFEASAEQITIYGADSSTLHDIAFAAVSGGTLATITVADGDTAFEILFTGINPGDISAADFTAITGWP